MGEMDGELWAWRRDDAARTVTMFDARGNVTGSRPYTDVEDRAAAARASQEALRARLRDARGSLASGSSMSVAARLGRLEAIVSDMLAASDG